MRLIAIDTETTGFLPHGKVCEIGAFDTRVASQALIDPGVPMPPEASAIHHLTDADLIGKPSIGDVWSQFEGMADVFIAHNAAFDREMLPETNKPWICTEKLASYYYADAPSYSLQVLRYWLKLEIDTPEGLHPHRALYDAICCAELYRYMVLEFGFTVEQAIDISNKPTLLRKMPFGKYKDQPLSSVAADDGYVDWLYKNADLSDDLAYSIKYWKSQV